MSITIEKAIELAKQVADRAGLTKLTVPIATEALNQVFGTEYNNHAHYTPIHKAIHRGILPAIKLGTAWYIEPTDLEKYMAEFKPKLNKETE